MKKMIGRLFAVITVIGICTFFMVLLGIYGTPMENKSYDLTIGADENVSEFVDEKGWMVFTQEGDAVKLLTHNGYGCYTGLDYLGQTFYYSRVLEEKLDSPTLQLDIFNRNFSVFLDGELIYTDCPTQDNRIGYLHLPMREWESTEKITIALPLDYQGKTLTIAQSSPEYSEREDGLIQLIPASVKLYCGYAYESDLIAESFWVAIAAAAMFFVGTFLLLAFLQKMFRGEFDMGLVFLAIIAFCQMTFNLTEATFFSWYFGEAYDAVLYLFSTLFPVAALLLFMSCKSGSHGKWLWGLAFLYIMAVWVNYGVGVYSQISVNDKLLNFLLRIPGSIGMISLLLVLVMGILFWRKENKFYRYFIPIVLICIAGYIMISVILPESREAFLKWESMDYIYFRLYKLMMTLAMVLGVVLYVQDELALRSERKVLLENSRMTLESYKDLRRHNEEVMMLRHDMNKHFLTLREMTGEDRMKNYLDELIGQNDAIRPILQSGNEILDIILNSKLSVAVDQGIQVDIIRADIPRELPLSDVNLCSLIMNIMDNAVTAASRSGMDKPYIRLDMHVKGNFFVLTCENSADLKKINIKQKKETVAKHGLGSKIIQQIIDRYEGLLKTEEENDHYLLTLALPLN